MDCVFYLKTIARHWTAAKHMEAAAALAKELHSWDEVADLYKQASKLYIQCQKPQPGADALSKGARCASSSPHPLWLQFESKMDEA